MALRRSFLHPGISRLLLPIAVFCLCACSEPRKEWELFTTPDAVYLYVRGGTYQNQYEGYLRLTFAGWKQVPNQDVPANIEPVDSGTKPGFPGFGPAGLFRPALPHLESAASSFTPVIYYSDSFTNSIVAIDASSGLQMNKAVLSGYAGGLALSPDGGTLYATASASYQQPNLPNYLAVVDTSTFQVANISLPQMSFPNWVAVSPDGATVYVSGEGFYQSVNGKDQTVVQSTIYAIDPVKRTVTATLPLPSQMGQGGRFGRLAVSPDGTTLVVNDQSKLIIVDTTTLTISKSIDINGLPAGPHVAFSPDGTLFYMAGYVTDGTPFTGGQPVAVLNGQTWTKLKYFSIGTSSKDASIGDLALSLDGSTLFVTNRTDGSTSLYDAMTGQLITSFSGRGHAEESMLLTAVY
jgi:WD40 repeat protein